MAELRKAKLSRHSDGSGEYVIEVTFHQFGDSPIPLDNGLYVPNTIAIVEHLDGRLEKVSIKRIKFDV